jgi:hypothetical protein
VAKRIVKGIPGRHLTKKPGTFAPQINSKNPCSIKFVYFNTASAIQSPNTSLSSRPLPHTYPLNYICGSKTFGFLLLSSYVYPVLTFVPCLAHRQFPVYKAKSRKATTHRKRIGPASGSLVWGSKPHARDCDRWEVSNGHRYYGYLVLPHQPGSELGLDRMVNPECRESRVDRKCILGRGHTCAIQKRPDV